MSDGHWRGGGGGGDGGGGGPSRRGGRSRGRGRGGGYQQNYQHDDRRGPMDDNRLPPRGRGGRGGRGRGGGPPPREGGGLLDADIPMDAGGPETRKPRQERFSPYGGRRPRRQNQQMGREDSYQDRQGGGGDYRDRRQGGGGGGGGGGGSNMSNVSIYHLGPNVTEGAVIDFLVGLVGTRFTYSKFRAFTTRQGVAGCSFDTDFQSARQIRQRADKAKFGQHQIDVSTRAVFGGGHQGNDRPMSSFDGNDLSQNDQEDLLNVLGSRYNKDIKLLSLSKMEEANPNYKAFARNFVSKVLAIVDQNCPEVESLDLSGNRLQRLEAWRDLGKGKAKPVNINLADNQIRDVRELDNLSNLRNDLRELILTGNSLTNNETYKAEVRKRFPKLKMLDMVELPPPVSFALPETGSLPPSQRLCNLVPPNVSGTIYNFLESYFSLFDAPQTSAREGLLPAYAPNAVFSLDVMDRNRGYNQPPRHQPDRGFYQFNRNLMNMSQNRDTARRAELLFSTPMTIVERLKQLPPTRHDLMQLAVDIWNITPTSVCARISGPFIEVLPHQTKEKAFHRTLVFVEAANGLAIVHDQLSILPLDYNQPPNQPVAQPATQQGVPPAAAAVPQVAPVAQIPQIAGQPTVEAQQQMMQTVIAATRLNDQYARDLLVSANWNLDQASTLYTQAKDTLPPTAYRQ